MQFIALYCMQYAVYCKKNCTTQYKKHDVLHTAPPLKILVRLRNLVIFGVFGLKFSAKKSIFQNCPIKRARRASRKGNFEKSIFLAGNFTPKTSKMTKIGSRNKMFERTVDLLLRVNPGVRRLEVLKYVRLNSCELLSSSSLD